jgi:hypothetical protein
VPPTDGLDATPDPQQDPSEDTLADGTEDTGQDDAENTVDWEARYKALQSHTSKQIDDLRSKLTGSSDGDESDDEEEEGEPEAPATSRDADRLEEQNWQLAETVFGPDAIKAYDKAARVLDKAQTPSDYVAAFEAYHQARLDAANKPRKRPQAQADQPSQPVDPNRPDTSPRNDYDRKAEEAFAKGDSKGFLLAQIQRIRGE